MRTVAHLYDSYATAETVVTQLEAAGFAHDAVSIVSNKGTAEPTSTTATTGTMASTTTSGMGTSTGSAAATGTGTGASIGTLVGGGAGLLAGIGALAIPGVGPVIAAGWLVATLTGAGAGAAAGGLLGSLTGAGVSDEHANVVTEGVRRGSTLVTVRADDARAAEAEAIMGRNNPVDLAQRGQAYRSTGEWTKFDESRGTMTSDELSAERARYSSTKV